MNTTFGIEYFMELDKAGTPHFYRVTQGKDVQEIRLKTDLGAINWKDEQSFEIGNLFGDLMLRTAGKIVVMERGVRNMFHEIFRADNVKMTQWPYMAVLTHNDGRKDFVTKTGDGVMSQITNYQGVTDIKQSRLRDENIRACRAYLTRRYLTR